MSTKTSIKRIAAVAAVALTLGGFSAVSAHAAASTTITGTSFGGTSTAATKSAIVGSYVSATITFVGDTHNATSVTSSGVGQLNVPSIAAGTNNVATTGISATGFTAYEADSATDVPGTSANTLGDLSASAGTQVGSVAISAYSATAGTQTISVASSTGTSTLTITWGAAPVVSTQYSTAFIGLGNSTGVVANGTSLVAPAAASANATAAANITVTLNSAASTPITGQGLTASVTGAGVVGINNGGSAPAAQGASVTYAAASGNSETFDVGLWADGRAGTATVTITSGTTAIATKTFVFYAAPAKAVATQVLKVGNKAGGLLGAAHSTADAGSTVGTKYAYTVDVTDANGNPSANAVVKATSSASTVIQSSACSESASTPGTWNCDVTVAASSISGQSATVTFSASSTASTSNYDVVANPLTFSVGGSIAKEVLSTDASSYTPLAPVKLTITATDSSGNPAYDQTGALATAAVSSIYVGGDVTTLTASKNLIGGVATFTGSYAPATVGEFTISATGTDANASALSATASSNGVSADSASQAAVDAANEATDAANAATDAANNAMDSADAAQQAALDAGDKADAALAAVTDLATKVSAIASQIASLSALVKKIAAKVKA